MNANTVTVKSADGAQVGPEQVIQKFTNSSPKKISSTVCIDYLFSFFYFYVVVGWEVYYEDVSSYAVSQFRLYKVTFQKTSNKTVAIQKMLQNMVSFFFRS